MGREPGRIVMVAYTRYPWDPRVRREAETLVRLRRPVTVVCARDEGQPQEDVVAGVAVVRVPLEIRRGSRPRYVYQYGLFLLLSAFAILRLRLRHPIAAVHVHSLPDFLVFSAAGIRLLGTPVVLDMHESMPEIFAARFPGRRGRSLALAAMKTSCLFSDLVIVTSETIRDLLIERGVPPKRLEVLYNSPDLDAIPPPPKTPPSGDGIHIVYAGGIDPERDLGTLLRAAAEISRVRPVRVEMYGHGPAGYREGLKALAGELGLTDVHVGGLLPRDEVFRKLARATVGVATYVRNPLTEVTLPTKAFECIALDKPLVMPDLPGMRRAFSEAALFYEPGDAEDLARKVLQLAQGGPEVDALRARARDVLKVASWTEQTTRLARLYDALTGRPAAGSVPCT